MKQKALVIAMDLGASKMRAAAISESGELLGRQQVPTPSDEPFEAVLPRIVALVESAREATGYSTVAGLGVAVASPIDPESGLLFSPPNIPKWDGVHLKEQLKEAFGWPLETLNDANAAALGEWAYGAAQGVDDFVLLTLGTGVGGGVVTRGRLLLGARGLAAELGHISIDRHGPLCTCGNRGCLESLASGTALRRLARSRLLSGAASSLSSSLEGGGPTGEAVMEAAREGDALARELVLELARNLALGIVSLVHVFNPELVVLGGGMGLAGEILLAPVREETRQRAMAAHQRGLRIESSALGEDGGLLGAAVALRRGLASLAGSPTDARAGR